MRAPAAAVLIATTLVALPLAAAEKGGSDQASDQAESKSRTKTDDKSDSTPTEKSADKPGGKPEAQSKDKSDSEAGDKAESKPNDPCDPEKLLINFEDRHWFCQSGIKFGLTETSEVLANLTGGLRQGAIYEGLTDVNLSIDFRPTFHWRGVFFARAYQIHGRGLTTSHLDNLNAASRLRH